MGQLSAEELAISPLASVVVFIVVLVCMEYGSRFFNRMQEPPALEWAVLSVFHGDLFDAPTRRQQLPSELGLGGVRSLYAISTDSDPTLQSRSASSIASLLHLAVNGGERPEPAQLTALAALTRKFTPAARGHAAIGLALAALDESLCPQLLECATLDPSL